MEQIRDPVLWYFTFLFSVVLHEAAHAYLAKLKGDQTAYLGGQVTLDPVPHIKRSPFGMVVLPIISIIFWGWPIGFASAPYDPVWAYRYPKRAATMAAAGPLSNLSLVILAGVLIRIGIVAGVFEIPKMINVPNVASASEPGAWEGVALILGIVYCLNLVLTVLNLIPVPPLDGSSVVMLFMKEATARKYHEFLSTPMFGIVGLLIAWKIFAPVFLTIFRISLNILYPETSYQ
ncbi:site-2 protease family protein [candidate division KSB1 bacterium]|nr:site-2 protease family protein [candidate division KSB1 bacterium]